MAYPIIDWDPAVPNRVTSTRTQFNLDVNEFLASLPTLKDQINTANAWVELQYADLDALGISYTDSITALADGYIATFNGYDVTFNQYLQIANDSADTAQQAAEAAAGSANFQGEWSTLTGAALKGVSVANFGRIWLLLVNLADVTLSEPSDTNSDCLLLSTTFKRRVLTTNTVLSNGGQFFVVGDLDITIANTNDGDVFDFVAAIGSAPKINGTISTVLFGDVDFVELDNQYSYQFVYNAISGKLEI